MLCLIFADRHQRALVQRNISRLKDGIREQPQPQIRLADLVLRVGVAGHGEATLPRRHALQPAHRADRVEVPRELGVLRHVLLQEEGCALRIHAARQKRREHVAAVGGELGRRLREGDAVQADDGEVDGHVGGCGRLQLEEGEEEAEVVSELRSARLRS